MVFTSWSPVIEFAWFYRVGRKLDIDRIYLFLFDNDFMSKESCIKGDQYIRGQFVFNQEGIPLYVPSFRANILTKKSYLLRYIRFNVIVPISQRERQFVRLFRDKIPPSKKMVRILKRFGGKSLYRVEPVEPYKNPSDLFKKHVVEEKFNWKHKQFVEMVLFRLPPSEWNEVLWQGINAAVKSITDFYSYLEKQGVELYVVYVPSGFDIDQNEHNAQNAFREGYAFLPTGSQGLEDYLRGELGKSGISVINLTQPLIDYKMANRPGGENFLYFKYDGHWNVNGHKAVAGVIEEHLTNYPVKLKKDIR